MAAFTKIHYKKSVTASHMYSAMQHFVITIILLSPRTWAQYWGLFQFNHVSLSA